MVACLAATVAACSGVAPAASGSGEIVVTDQVRADLRTLAKTRVFFAHHSVGRNVLDGLAALAREAAVPLTIAPADAPLLAGAGGAVLESAPGENGRPDSKLAAFTASLSHLAGPGGPVPSPQVALVKLCFVDFNPTTDAGMLFDRYRTTVADLQGRYPTVKFVHVTVPLTVRPHGWKDALKRALGRSVWEDDANARRRDYNAKLRKAFAGQPLFDLAAIESTRPDGTMETFAARDGQTTPALFAGYASDGAHLNTVGSHRAAAAFAHVIATAVTPL